MARPSAILTITKFLMAAFPFAQYVFSSVGCATSLTQNAGYFFFASRYSGALASVKITTSSPVSVLMS